MTRRTWANAIYWLVWGAAIAFYLIWPLTHLEAYAWSNDEGLYVQRAALANAGHPLYTETAFNKPPLLIWILQLAFRLGGTELVVARLTILCMTTLGLIALAAVTGQLWERWAGLVAICLLLTIPEIPVRAHVVTSDLPAMALAMTAMATALSFRRTGRRLWALATGTAFAGTMMIHPLLGYTALPIALAAFLNLGFCDDKPPFGRLGWQDLLAFVGPVVALGTLTLIAIDVRASFGWIYRQNVSTASRALRAAPLVNLRRISSYLLGDQWPLLVLSVIGALTLSKRRPTRRPLIVIGAWWLVTLITLTVWSPLWVHYLLFLMFPLAITAGAGLAELGQWAIGGSHVTQPSVRQKVLLSALATVGLITLSVKRYNSRLPYLTGQPEWTKDQRRARSFLKGTAPADEFVITDDPLLAFSAGRLVPPPLTALSHKRINSGDLTAGDMVEHVSRYEARVVLLASGRLERLPLFEHWVAEVAQEKHTFGSLRGYRLTQPLYPAHSQPTTLGDDIRLHGYSLSQPSTAPGEPITVTLYWEKTGVVDGSYHVFVHLVGPDGTIQAQHDSPPIWGSHPITEWEKDVLLPDPHVLTIDPNASPGESRLFVGMYRWPSLERLPATRANGTRWPDDRILLTRLSVHP